MSLYTSGGQSGGHSILFPCSMKAMTSGPFIFCSGQKQRYVDLQGPPSALSHLTSYHFTTSHLTSCHFISSHFTSPSLITYPHFASFPPLHPSLPTNLVGLLAIGESLPHGDTVTPYITAAGELSEVDAFRCIPLERPFTG